MYTDIPQFSSIPFIMLTCPCNVYPLTPHFYIVNVGAYRGIHYFLTFALKHILWVLVRTCTHNICFELKYENSKKKSAENCHFYSREKSPYFTLVCFRNVQVAIKHSHCTKVLTSNEPTTSLIPALGKSEHRYFHDRSYYEGNDRRCIYLCPTNPLANKERKFDCVLPVRKSHCWI